ncbi:MAG TPA: MarR family winged helix-turn-helix transcriptional regulator [Anaerolineales bacterium]|nr:MarR family winged helix-turn-helix transcriptional regulator [Anaerolineales bacterium]
MRDNRKTWQLMSDTSSSIYPLAQEVMQEQFEAHFTERRFYTPCLVARGLAPNPITVEVYSKRNPYANPSGINNLLVDMASAGYLDQDGNGGYQLSAKGAVAVSTINDTFYSHINKVDPFPADKREELAALLAKLVVTATEAELDNGNLCLNISFNGHPKVEPGTLAVIDQRIDDLHAFRDDAHISAWTPTGVDGHTWEVLSFVWNGEADTVEKLVERLPFRNYTADDYKKTLDDLAQRGWIEPRGKRYKITEKGRKIREDAEAATDANFFGPWEVLTDDEFSRLGELLDELKKTNIKFAEQTKAA